MQTTMEGYRVIEEGVSVNIKRTDGRVHSALISGINWDTNSVTVEWFERGETKGKEVEITAVLALNPDVTCGELSSFNQNAGGALQQSQIVTTSNALHQGSSEDSDGNSSEAYLDSRNEDVNSNPSSGVVPLPKDTDSRQTISKIEATTSKVAKARPSTSSDQSAAAASSSNADQPKTQVVSKTGRRSNVVKEIDRLKKNREERRLRQAEEKAEKEALMKQDQGNPNWEFVRMIRDFQSTLEYRPLVGNEPEENYQITVCVRKRPLFKREVAKKEVDILTIPTKDMIIVHEPKSKVDLTKYLENHTFRFDFAFNEHCTNEMVYKFTAKPLVRTVFEGGMATCFAYGQTGSGKTYTMSGVHRGQEGIYTMVARDVFHCLATEYKHLNLVVSASFFEIYTGKVFDLLTDKQKLRVLEDANGKVKVMGLAERAVHKYEEVLRLIQKGNASRTSGQTSANANSSRSHAIFQILLRKEGKEKIHGKFSLIDLAGNERGADTSSSDRQTRMEGAEINKSLLALKECIRAMSKRNTHLPFRVSTLTQVLRDSFIGDNSRICMIAMVSPGLSSCENSLNTLRYADRVKELSVADVEARMEASGSSEMMRSTNEGDDLTPEMYEFHDVVSQLQLAEEEMLDNHRTCIDFLQYALTQTTDVFNTTKAVDYDQDEYSLRWKNLLEEQIAVLTHSRDLVTEYRKKMAKEEKMSRQMGKK